MKFAHLTGTKPKFIYYHLKPTRKESSTADLLLFYWLNLYPVLKKKLPKLLIDY